MPANRRRVLREILPVLPVAALVVAVFGLYLFGGHLVDQGRVERLLTDQGMTDVSVTHRATLFVNMRGCGERDLAKFTADATNANGKRVTVTVCGTWPFGGVTMRG